MKAKQTCVCRGDGRCYTSLLITDFTRGSKLKLTGTTDAGNHVPTQLYVTDETESSKVAVLVFPLVPCSINLAIEETGGSSSSNSSCSFRINPLALKWQSRLNYRIKGDACAKIRDIDGTDFFRHATIKILECIPSQGNTIIRGTIILPTTEAVPYTLALLDQNLKPIKTSFIIMNDAIVPATSTVPTPVREIGFSVQATSISSTYVISFSDPSERIRPNFATLESGHYEELINRQHAITLNASQDVRYHDWFKRHAIDEAIKKEQRNATPEHSPLVSIVVPLFRTPLSFFGDMTESVLAQTYENFELILINADPENIKLAQAVKNLEAKDPRVREVKLEENLGISLNTDKGIDAARGEYVAFLDHDDLIEPNALFEYVSAINSKAVDLLYCDEDKLFPDGTYGDPYFKPDFSPHLLREVNYICHFLMIKKDLLSSLAPADPLFDGAQDHRMVLQAVQHGAQICHVPRVLYHWRISEGSTASGTGEKPYADKAGKLAVEEHLSNLFIPGTVLPTEQACRYKVRYDIAGEPLVSIIIPNKDNSDVLDVCLKSICEKSTYKNFEIIIVENNSTDDSTFAYYDLAAQRDSRIHVKKWNHEFNFSKLMNFGAHHSSGEYLLLLNNDTEVISPSWIESMLGICQENEVGAVGAKLYYRDGTIQHAGVYVQGAGAGHLNLNLDRSETGYYHTATSTREVSAVTAACVMTKREAFEKVGGFTEEFAVAFNDVDYCLKLRDIGYSIVFTPQAELYHYESLSRGYEMTASKKVRFHREASLLNAAWPEYYVLGDPFMNVNLHPDCGYFRLGD